MAFVGIAGVASSLGQIVHAQYADGITSVLGANPEMEFMDRFKESIEGQPGVDATFKILTKSGSNSVGPTMPSSRTMRSFQDVGFGEGKYRLKMYQSTLEFGLRELKFLNQAFQSNKDLTQGAYVSATDYVDEILMDQTINWNHKIMADIFGDGSGVLATVASIDVTSLAAAGKVVITINNAYSVRGATSLLRIGTSVIGVAPDGTVRTTLTGSPTTTYDSLEIDDIDVVAGTVTVLVTDATRALVTGATGINIGSGDYIYFGTVATATQSIIPDLSGSVTEWDLLTDHIIGLKGHTANDGRIVQGLPCSGRTAAQVQDWGNATLTPNLINAMFRRLGSRWSGYNVYKWNKVLLAAVSHEFIINNTMADRRITASNTAFYGATEIQHWEGQSGATRPFEYIKSIFCPPGDIYILPEAAEGMKALTFAYEDPQDVFEGTEQAGTIPGFLPKPNNNKYDAAVVKYEEQRLALYSKNRGIMARGQNFKLS